jgi:hypothetical protein
MRRLLFLLLIVFYFSCNENNQKKEFKDGKHQEFYDNGNLSLTGYYKNQKKTGVWKHFNKKGDLEQVFMYIQDTIFKKLDKNDFNYTFEDIEFIKVPVPKNWSTTKEFDNPNILIVAEKKKGESNYFNPTITISKDTLNGKSFKEYIKIEKEKLSNVPNLNIISLERSELREDAYIIKYNYTLKEGVSIASILIILKNNNEIILFQGSSDVNYIYNYKMLFLEIGYSIKFNK